VSLINIINEKIEKIKPEKIITDLTQNEDTDIIDEYVNSKKKDDRIAIAANPNLTIEQQTKLSNDRVNGVKQALCYNSKLDVDLAKKLLDEEPKRINFIARYGGKQLDNIVLDHVKTIESSYSQENMLGDLFKSPEISDETIKTIIKDYPKSIISSNAENLMRNKNLSKKSVYNILDHLVKYTHFSPNLTKLIINQSKFIKEADIKKLDWKNNENIKEAIFYREDMSEGFVIDTIKSLKEGESTHALANNKENKNKNSFTILNALLQQYATFKKFSYVHEFNIFEKSNKMPLDPKAMIAVVKTLLKYSDSTYDFYAEHILRNESYPDYGLDILPINDKTIPVILSNTNISPKRAKDIIMNINDFDTMQSAILKFSSNQTLMDLDDDIKMFMFNNTNAKKYWMERVPNGKLVDDILENLDKWKEHFLAYKDGENKPSKWEILKALTINKALTNTQRKLVLKKRDYVVKEENITYGTDLEKEMITTKFDDPEFLEEMVSKNPENIWEIWTASGSAYFQYSKKIVKTIDKLALKTDGAPEKVLSGISNKNFTSWFDHNNQNGVLMSKDTAKKYLLHFIKTSDNDTKILLKGNFIDDDWLEDPDVMSAMYELTDNDKYLPQAAKDIFLF